MDKPITLLAYLILSGYMIDTASLRLLLNDEQQVAEIRAGIVNLISILLERRQFSLDSWETMHIADAIGALSLNVRAVQQPSFAWLRLCLNDIDMAQMPRTKRPLSAAAMTVLNDRPSYPQLRAAIDALAADIERLPGQAE